MKARGGGGGDWPRGEGTVCVFVCCVSRPIQLITLDCKPTFDRLCIFSLPLRGASKLDFYATFPIFKILCKSK